MGKLLHLFRTPEREHATGHIRTDCVILHAAGDWPTHITEAELAGYRQRVGGHGGLEAMTLGHLHTAPDAHCWHAGEPCAADCDCDRTEFSRAVCDMCGSHLA